MKKQHKLRIISLNDGQAECTCGNWYICYTGELTKKEIKKEYKLHKKA